MLDTASRLKSNIPTCSICKYQYDSYYRIPRVIPKCGHTFCQKCINSNLQVRANRKMFICTQCHSQTVIRKGASDDVPKNIGILDIVKTMKKQQFQQTSPMSHKSPVKDSPSNTKYFCKQHTSKQLDLVCQTCSYQKVCSICVLIGNCHQDHKFVQYVPASKFDLNEVKQVFTIIQDTVKQTILPHAQQNIIKRNEQNLIKMLVNTVKQHFREHYYKLIEKKQNDIISQVKQIKFEGGISKKIQQIAKHYDLLKIQYGDIFSIRDKQNASLEIVQDFIQKCKNVHNEVQLFSQHAQKQSKMLFKDISTKINQSICFRVTQLPFSLKQLLQNQQSFQVTSPSKYNRNQGANTNSIKKKNVEFGVSKQMGARGQGTNSRQQSQQVKSVQNISFDIERKPFTANSINTKNKSSFMPPKHKINKTTEVNNNVNNNNYLSNLSNNINSNIKQKQSDLIPLLNLDSKVNQKKSINNQSKLTSHTQRLNKSSFENIKQQKRSIQKQKSASKLHLSRLESHEEYSSNTDNQQLKMREVRPLKQVPLAIKSKYSSIIKQINRQSQSQSLELIGMEINDSLIMYICEYLKVKKLKFVMIKLVKNNLTDDGLSMLLGHLQNDDTTQVLNLTSNQLTAKSLDLLIELGNKNSFLKTIYLSHNKMSSISVKQKIKQFQNLGLDVII